MKSSKGTRNQGLDRFQKFVLMKYDAGDMAYITSMKEAKRCGDSLVPFLLAEVREDSCQTVDEVIRRLDMAQRQINELIAAFRSE